MNVDVVYFIIDFNKNIDTGYGFRKYKYAQIDVFL